MKCCLWDAGLLEALGFRPAAAAQQHDEASQFAAQRARWLHARRPVAWHDEQGCLTRVDTLAGSWACDDEARAAASGTHDR